MICGAQPTSCSPGNSVGARAISGVPSLRHLPGLALTIVCLLSVTRAASAQAFISPFFGYNVGGDAACPAAASCPEKSVNLGVAFGSLNAIFGFEEEVGYSKNLFRDTTAGESSVVTLMSNVIVGPLLGYVRPYGVGGVGLMKTKAALTPSSFLAVSSSDLGWNVGGGLMVSYGHIGIRGDVRVYRSVNELEGGLSGRNAKVHFGRVAVGLVIQ